MPRFKGAFLSVVRYEQIQVAVFVIVEESASGVPAVLAVALIGGNTGLLRNISELAMNPRAGGVSTSDGRWNNYAAW